jgi:hypothetical protein
VTSCAQRAFSALRFSPPTTPPGTIRAKLRRVRRCATASSCAQLPNGQYNGQHNGQPNGQYNGQYNGFITVRWSESEPLYENHYRYQEPDRYRSIMRRCINVI